MPTVATSFRGLSWEPSYIVVVVIIDILRVTEALICTTIATDVKIGSIKVPYETKTTIAGTLS